MKLQNHENVVIKADPIGFCLYDAIRQKKNYACLVKY